MSDAVAVRPTDTFDPAGLEAHLRQTLDVPDASMDIRQFTGGSANLTFQVSFGEAVRLVVRRPPRGQLATGSHDMAREYRVLSRLNAVYPRAPRAIAFCSDETVIGAPFVTVEHRDGLIIRDEIPPSLGRHPDVARRVDLALLDATADLHAVDPTAAGLAELGNPDGFARRQVQGWHRRWRRAAAANPTVDGAAATAKVMEVVAERLDAGVPAEARSAVVHNDLKLDNCQFQPEDPDTVTSVFDWDMATLGDPLFDLGLLLVSMQSNPAWVLSPNEAVKKYADRSGADVRGIDWYLAFATWRTAIVLQQLHNRFIAGDSNEPRFARFAAAIPQYVARAHELASRA